MNQQLENSLAKYFCGEASPEEQKLVERWKVENQIEFENYRKAYSLNIFSEQKFSPENKVQEVMLRAELKSAIASKNTYRMWFRIAAIFIGLMAIGVLLSFYNRSLTFNHTNTTAYMETLEIPDGSEIILASNSSVSYKLSWLGHFNREINFNGRAFFHITKMPEHPFSVNTENLKVTVLGTQFTVNEIDGNTQVVLTEGRVRLQSDVIETPIELNQPGDQVIVNDQSIIKQNNVDPDLYAAWKDEKLYFNNCTVAEIVNLLDDSYNVQLDLDDESMLNRKLFGSAPSDNPQLIIKALSQILQRDFEIK